MSEIFTIPDFLDPLTCRRLRASYEAGLSSKKFEPRGKLTTDIGLSVVSGACRHVLDLRALRDSVLSRVKERYGFEVLYPDYSAYARVLPGGSHVLHADAFKLDGTPNHTPHRVATALIYLGAHGKDFHGGELVLPGLVIRPTPGLVVAFESTVEHEVRRVTTGTRDAISLWFTRDQRRKEHWPDGAANRGANLIPCVHLGGPTGETRQCPTCSQKKVDVSLHACQVHGTCTTSVLLPQTACCANCKDRR